MNENMIDVQSWQIANKLTRDVDNDDIGFVALAIQKNAWLWTGDKKLSEHLKNNGFSNVINTPDLYDLLEIG